MNAKNNFREKGHSILKGSPYSMKDFIEDNSESNRKNTSAQVHKTAETQIHSGPKPQLHKDALAQNLNSIASHDPVERLHVQIRKDLADKLIQMVYTRKLSEKKASQRSIIEEALEQYFKRQES